MKTALKTVSWITLLILLITCISLSGGDGIQQVIIGSIILGINPVMALVYIREQEKKAL
jgi:hypothetical protein